MRLLITISFLLLALGMQAQPYTVTQTGCRVYFSNALDREAFLVDQIMWKNVGGNADQVQFFDGISAITVQDADLVNYPTTDSLIEQVKIWIVQCDTAGATPPTPPTPPVAPFANTRSLEMDGTAEYMSIPDADDLSFTDNTMMMSAWVRPNDATSYPVVYKTNEYYLTLNATDQVEARFIDASTGGYVRAVSEPVTSRENTWFHVLALIDGDSAKIYIDGSRSDTLQLTSGTFTAMENTANDVYVGYDGTNFADGYVDQVVIYVADFNPQEIREVVAIRNLEFSAQYASVVGWWEFDSDTLGTGGVSDKKGTNDGTLVGSEYADINPYVTWPRPLQLDTATNTTPMQDAAGNVYGGFTYYLNNTDEYFYADDNDLLSFGNAVTDSPFSICVWSDPNDNEFAPFVYKEDEYYFASDLASGHPTILFQLFNGVFSDFIQVKYDQTTELLDVDTRTDLWCVTYDGSGLNTGMEIYRDGNLVTPVRGSLGTYTAMHNTGNNVEFGLDDGKTRFFDGHYGDVAIYDIELSAAQVDSIYNNHAPLDETQTGRAGNLVLYYRPYDDCWTCDSIYDQSGNNLHGLKINMDERNLRYHMARYTPATTTTTFNGTDEYITFSDSDSLTFTNAAGTADTSFTISFWSKQVQGAEGAISKPDEYEIFGFTSNDFRVRLGTGSAYIGRQANNVWTVPQNFDNWVVTYDGSETAAGIKIYKNKVRVDNIDVTAGSYAGMSNTANPLRFGWAETINYYYGGQLSAVTIMKGVELTLAQIEEQYNDGSPEDPRKWTFYDPTFLHWILDENNDLTTTDGVLPYLGQFYGTATNMDAGNINRVRYPKN